MTKARILAMSNPYDKQQTDLCNGTAGRPTMTKVIGKAAAHRT